MRRLPARRVLQLIRLGLASDCGAAAAHPWTDGSRSGFEFAVAGLAVVAGLLLLSLDVPWWPQLAHDYAYALCAVALVGYALDVVLSHEAGQARSVLHALGGAVVAVALLAADRRPPAVAEPRTGPPDPFPAGTCASSRGTRLT